MLKSGRIKQEDPRLFFLFTTTYEYHESIVMEITDPDKPGPRSHESAISRAGTKRMGALRHGRQGEVAAATESIEPVL